jgi:SAM-dependent methyltransferase
MERFQNTGQPDWDWWGQLWPAPGLTLQELGIETGESVAEVGCGSGYFALPAARIADTRLVYALDLDEGLLDKLDQLATQQNINNVVTIHGDARNLPAVLPEAVDTLVVANTLHGIEQKSEFVRAAFETIASDGRLVIINWHDQPREETTIDGEPRGPPTQLRMTPEESKSSVCSGSEFTCSRQVELPPYHYGLVFDK